MGVGRAVAGVGQVYAESRKGVRRVAGLAGWEGLLDWLLRRASDLSALLHR